MYRSGSLSSADSKSIHEDRDSLLTIPSSEQAIRKILEGTASTTAQNFFRSAVKHLAELLNTKYAFISQLLLEPTNRVRTLATFRDGRLSEGEEYNLVDSPTERIIKNGFYECNQGVQIFFPKDQFLKDESIISYMGAPIIGSNGQALGVISVMDSKPLPSWEAGQWILRIFAARAGAELERIEMEKETIHLQQCLLQSQKMDAVGQLAAGIAHDLNNALFAVTGHLQLMRIGNLASEAIDNSVKSALTGCERAASLIEQLLCFSRQGKYNVQTLSLKNIIKETISFLGKILSKEIILETFYLEHDISIMGDSGQIQQVLTNIIINAQQAMPEGGKISLYLSQEWINEPQQLNNRAKAGRFAHLRIKDTGGGIPSKILPKVFEPFFTTKEVGKGSGLGLAMVYGTMQHHGGWVLAESDEGVGATFHLFFPLANQSENETKVRKMLNKDLEMQGTILLIDDEEIVTEVATKFLALSGFTVHPFTQPRQAMTWYKNHSHEVDLIILDMKMPSMNGEECFHAIRRIKHDSRIIIVSGFIQDESAQTLLQNGAIKFFQKPLKFEELRQWLIENISYSETGK